MTSNSGPEPRNRRRNSASNWRKTDDQKLQFETLEPRRVLAAATFDAITGTLDVSLAASDLQLVFDHDGQYFPIYTGKHREGEAWNDCVECHANPATYADFTCFTCHLKPEMDDKHSEENGYEYVSTTCLECHPDGTN